MERRRVRRDCTHAASRPLVVVRTKAGGTFDDLTTLGPGQDDVDLQLDQLGANSAVNDELAKLKAEVGSGAESPALATGESAGGSQRRLQPSQVCSELHQAVETADLVRRSVPEWTRVPGRQ